MSVTSLRSVVTFLAVVTVVSYDLELYEYFVDSLLNVAAVFSLSLSIAFEWLAALLLRIEFPFLSTSSPFDVLAIAFQSNVALHALPYLLFIVVGFSKLSLSTLIEFAFVMFFDAASVSAFSFASSIDV